MTITESTMAPIRAQKKAIYIFLVLLLGTVAMISMKGLILGPPERVVEVRGKSNEMQSPGSRSQLAKSKDTMNGVSGYSKAASRRIEVDDQKLKTGGDVHAHREINPRRNEIPRIKTGRLGSSSVKEESLNPEKLQSDTFKRTNPTDNTSDAKKISDPQKPNPPNLNDHESVMSKNSSRDGIRNDMTSKSGNSLSNDLGNTPFSGMEFFDGSGNKVTQHDKWIVVTSINGPTKDIIALSKVPGWKLVVVGDTKTPKDWKCPNVVFLDVETQMKMGLQVLSYIPTKSYARKNIGYLFALKHGARHIYDTDDDNQPNDELRSFDMSDGETTNVLLVETTNLTFNPYPHFGQRTIWPRGFPLDLIMGDQPRDYKLCKMPTPLLRQGVVNGDPDVDAIFRLIKKHPRKRVNVFFDRKAPRVVLPVNTIAPYNSQNTISSYDAFWGLLFPVTLNFRVCDIWRSYWAQRLFWMIGHRIGFYTAGTFQFRSPHSFLKDFKDEHQLYHQATDFVTYLSKWQCQSTVFFACVKELSYDMAAKKFWNETDAKLVDAWIHDLQSLGYKEPLIKETKKGECLKPASKVIFYPHEQPATFGESTTYYLPRMFNKFDRLRRSVHEVCPRPQTINPNLKLNGNAMRDDILLIIRLKTSPTNDTIRRMEAFYRPRFSQILYCGTWQEAAKPLFHHWQVSFVGISNSVDPSLACLLKAAEMHYLVDGYYVIQQEMIVNINTMRKEVNAVWVANNWLTATPQPECQKGDCRHEQIYLEQVTKLVLADGKKDVYSNIYQGCPFNKPGMQFSYRPSTAFYIPAQFNQELRNMADGNIPNSASVFAWLHCLSPKPAVSLQTSPSLTAAVASTDIVEYFDYNNIQQFCLILGYDA